jgi:hypothetical protein
MRGAIPKRHKLKAFTLAHTHLCVAIERVVRAAKVKERVRVIRFEPARSDEVVRCLLLSSVGSQQDAHLVVQFVICRLQLLNHTHT